MTTPQPKSFCVTLGAGTAFIARYGEPEWRDSVEILQGSRRFGLEQYVPHRWVCCPVDPYRVDLFSDARPGADHRLRDVLAGQRQRLPPLGPEGFKTTKNPHPKNTNIASQHQSYSRTVERATVSLMAGTTSLRCFSAASGSRTGGCALPWHW